MMQITYGFIILQDRTEVYGKLDSFVDEMDTYGEIDAHEGVGQDATLYYIINDNNEANNPTSVSDNNNSYDDDGDDSVEVAVPHTTNTTC
jgi:hypothetical protein